MDAAPRERKALDEQVLRHRKAWHEAEVLMDEAEAAPVRLADRKRKSQPLPHDLELAFFRRDHAGENLDQRALAGSVLAEQAVHLARYDANSSRVERQRAAIAFLEAGRL